VRKSEYFNLPTIDSGEGEVLKGFLLDFYQRRPLPGEIIVASLPEQAQALEKLFSERAGRRVRIRTVRQGRKRSILDLALQNLALFIQKNDYRLLAERIREQLGLRNFPALIEGYDISHLGEKNRVGARVVFKNGRPEKRSYRSYLIRGASGGDTGALSEVLSRRFAGEAEQPDLLLIDGGRPQMAAARQVKEKLGLRSDLLALAKGEERIFLEDGSSLLLVSGSPAKFLFQNIRDEVHRRAISHHRRRREKLPG
jgi:excinuclease ABC subunit C